MAPDILHQVEVIIKKTFDDNDVSITLQTTADDVDEWDSMTHLELIDAIEKHFKIRFALGELQSLKNVGDMVKLISKKISL
jgi:acyl carrier protein